MEILIGPTIIAAGILLLIFRYPFMRLGRRWLSTWFGPAVGEEAMDPRTAGPAMVIVPIIFMIFGCYVFVDALLF
ncbi:hypothetical protein GCM10027421_10360 [Microbacterium shaanxiense]